MYALLFLLTRFGPIYYQVPDIIPRYNTSQVRFYNSDGRLVPTCASKLTVPVV